MERNSVLLFIKKNQTRRNSVSNFISYLYEVQHVSGDTPPIIRSLKLHWQPLVFHTWKVVGRVVGRRCQAQCSFRLLMMGGVSPETCLASYKYGIINFDTLLHLVGFSFMNDMIYLLTAIGLTPGGSSTVHIVAVVQYTLWQ